MARFFAGLSALLIYGSLGVASAVGGPLSMSQPLDSEAPLNVEAEDVEASDSAEPVPMGGMSQAEKERRHKVCDQEYDACYDQCTRFYANKKGWSKLNPFYSDCSDKNTECRKKIPS